MLLYHKILERQVAILVVDLGEAARTGSRYGVATVRGAIAASRCAVIARTGIAVTLGVTEVDVVNDDFGGAALVAVLVGPVTHLQAAFHHGHTALGKYLDTNSADWRHATTSMKSVSFVPSAFL